MGTPPQASAQMTDLRVLVVMPIGDQRGSGEIMFRQLMEHGRGQGIEWIAVFTEDGPMVAEMRGCGVETHLIEAGRIRDLGRRWRAIRQISALARERQVSLVFGWMVSSQLLAGPAAWLADIPAAWYQVGLPSPDWIDRFATFCRARGIVVLSRDVAAAQARIAPRRPQQVVYPGASLDHVESVRAVSPGVLRQRFGLPTTGPLIGIVGRLQRGKGMHTLVAAMPAVRTRHADAHLVIVGAAHDTEPGYADELKRLARAAGVEQAVTFAGDQADVPHWMQAMDIVVHASDREPFGIVVVEAMALAKPVVAGAAGGPAEIITSGQDGLLAPFDDVPALAKAVLRFLDDPEFSRRCGAAAHTRAQDFSARRYATHLVQVVRELALGEEP